MLPFRIKLTLITLLSSSFLAFNAYAKCILDAGFTRGTTTINFGNIYIPRDAPIGSVIGTREYYVSRDWKNTFVCRAPGDNIQFSTANKIISDIPVAGTTLASGSLMGTNISGIGVIVRTEEPSYNWEITGSYPYVPYTITLGPTSQRGRFFRSAYWVTLVKIGEITTGSQDFSHQLLSSLYASDISGPIDQLFLDGSITRSECTLPKGVGTQIKVSMGTIEKRHFNGKGSTSDAAGFNIQLTDCVSGSYPTDQPWNFFQTSNANIRFEGAKGSTVLDADKGILSLNSDSTATGLAVQILQADGKTPVTLGVDTPIVRLQDGITDVPLKARYIQTSSSAAGPQPGSANATANFTLTYK
ncbi:MULTISPECIES: fimbrial protein [Pseudomonas]|uniref:fimbrial protein n=1 Tax=Pseudomonas TaxID=286 RepID=UPI000B3568C5|nr:MULTISPECIES: fimbrial protein [Pseudomonas]PMY64843.1 long polar fimbrial protein LpfA [Pseudomonas sp. FW305-25]PMY69237.1 long polar fimbrial protein LpfA [Pseudomonas sp. FW126-L8]PNA80074.1 long polar fimbrial protein LpfA [Pseudomonas sp. FW305-76]